MQTLKKLCAFCMIFCMILSCFTAMPIAASEQHDKLTQLMLKLEIYDSSDRMELHNDRLTRAELASILSVFYGVKELSYPLETEFKDVPANWSGGHIMTMVQNGIMNGYSDGLFRPDSFVTLEQIVKILTVMTGYETIAIRRGGFPQGYFYVASDKGMLKNVNLENRNREITKEEFTTLLYNTLNVDLMQVVAVGEATEFKIKEDKTLLTEKLNIYKLQGVLEALPYVSLGYEEPAKENKIRISGIRYECFWDAYKYLGLEVEGYYRQTQNDPIGEVLYLEERSAEENFVMIEAKDIIEVTKDKFLFIEKNKEKEIELTDDLVVIFNGKRLTYYTLEHLKPYQGYVKFVDSDFDNVYDHAIVNYEVNYCVDGVSDDGSIYYITDTNGKTPIKIDTKACEYYSVSDKGLNIAVNKIRKGAVVSVSADSVDILTKEIKQDSTVIKINHSENKISGVVTAIDDEFIYIDDVEYALAGDFGSVTATVKPGNSYNFYMNYLNEVVTFDGMSSEMSYGILVGSHKISRLDDTVQLKIFTQDGELVVAECIDGIRIDGYGDKDYKDVVEYLKGCSAEFISKTEISVANDSGVWQLIRYRRTEEGLLAEIDTIKNNRMYNSSDLSFFSAHTKNAGIGWYGATGALGGIYGVTKETIMFQLYTDASDIEAYHTFDYNALNNNTQRHYFFDADELNVSKVLIRQDINNREPQVATYESTNLMIYEKTIPKINDRGETANFMRGTLIKSGASSEVEISDSINLNNLKIKPGDFVRWLTDKNGVAIAVERMKRDNTAEETGKNIFGYGLTIRINMGIAKAKNDSYFMIRFEGSNGACDDTCLYNNVEQVFIFDTQRNKIIKASMDDVRTEAAYGAGDKVALYHSGGQLKTVVIYR